MESSLHQINAIDSLKYLTMKVKITQSCLTLWDPMDCILHGILQARILERVALPFSSGSPFPSPVDIPNPGIEPRSPALQAVSLPAQPQRKSEYMGVGSLSLLQQIFLTQELNRGLLHYRQILYQLSYEGSHIFDNKYQKIW